VLRDGAAERAGVSAGDELIAVDGWRIRRIDDAQRLMKPGVVASLLLARDQRLLNVPLCLPAEGEVAGTIALSIDLSAPRAAAALRKAWLGG
jgi:predicted metalloprotease with PDZ domain